jgi:hypothetical protein
MDLRAVMLQYLDWIQAVVNTVMNLQVPYEARNFMTG